MHYLQNLYSCRKPTEQGIPLAIMAGKRILKGKGAIRVHGGGFAGTVQAFVPNDLVNAYRSENGQNIWTKFVLHYDNQTVWRY